MGHFIKKVQTIEEYHTQIVPTEESSYDYWNNRTEETQFPNICYVAEGNQIKYKSNTPLIVDICYVVQGWSNSADDDFPQSINISILNDEYSSDDDIIQIQNNGDEVAIKDYIDRVEYNTSNHDAGEILNTFYNASINISNPQEGQELRVYIRYYLKRPIVNDIIEGAFLSGQTWSEFTTIDLARIEVKSGCNVIQTDIFNNFISDKSKYKTQVILHDIVPPIDSNYFMLLGDATVIYVPKVVESIYKENEFYALAADVIQGYDLNDFPENHTLSVGVMFDVELLNLERLDSNQEDNPIQPIIPPVIP